MRVAIIGLGLIGGSLGLALKRARGKEVEIMGYARRPETISQAMELGAIDSSEPSLTNVVRRAELIIIATPVTAIKEVLQQIAPCLLPNTIVTDTASTKVQVMEWAGEYLSPKVDFIGGHPMAGKEKFGIQAAQADLFQGSTYCLTTAAETSPEATQSIVEMVEEIGAIPFFTEASEHDYLVAGISHLPLLLSAALVSVTTQNPSWGKMAKLAATGYKDLTRLASGNPKVNGDICLTNKEAILHWIDGFTGELERFRQLVASGGDELERVLAEMSEARQRWLQQRGGER